MRTAAATRLTLLLLCLLFPRHARTVTAAAPLRRCDARAACARAAWRAPGFDALAELSPDALRTVAPLAALVRRNQPAVLRGAFAHTAAVRTGWDDAHLAAHADREWPVYVEALEGAEGKGEGYTTLREFVATYRSRNKRYGVANAVDFARGVAGMGGKANGTNGGTPPSLLRDLALPPAFALLRALYGLGDEDGAK